MSYFIIENVLKVGLLESSVDGRVVSGVTGQNDEAETAPEINQHCGREEADL